MGYSNPKININKSLSVINSEIRNFQGKFDQALGEANDRRIENFNANVEALEKAKAKKLMGEDAWYQQYGKYEPKGGYEKGVESYLKSMHDRYYNLIGCDDPECIAQRRALLSLPKELSEDAGAFEFAQGTLNESLSKVGVDNNSVVPGGFNAFDTPAKFREILQNGGKLVPVFNEETLHTDYKMVDENGEQKGELISGRDFTQSILKGEQTVATYGDPASIAKEIHKKSYDELNIESLGISEIDKTDPAYQTKVKDYTQARQVYNEAIKDPRLYEPTLNNVETMRRSWPVMITDMVKLAKTDAEGSEEARIALGPLLGGEDGKFGGDYSEDDNAYTPQAAAGQWDNSDLHRSIALTYFTRDNPADNIMPPLERQTTAVEKGGLTAYQQTQVANQERDDARALLKLQQAAAATNEEAKNISSKESAGKTVTPNEQLKFIKWYETQAKEREMSSTDKALYDKYSKNLIGNSTSGSTSKPPTTKIKDYGTMTSTEFASKMNKENLKPGQVFSYTNEKGIKKTFKYNGPGNFEKISEEPAVENKGVTGVSGVTGITGPVEASGTIGS